MREEKPLEKLEVINGGYTSIFQTIGCIGDSLASGEFESLSKDGVKGYHDMYEYSWGQFMARDAGIKVYNFSKGGMTAKEYMINFGNKIDAFNPDKKCVAYIIALGVNDLFGKHQEFGTIDDLENHKDTFSRYYQEIIVKYKEIQPDAKFFLMTFPKEDSDDEFHYNLKIKQRDFLYALTEKYENMYVLDIYQYGPIYGKEFDEKFRLRGHLNPMGYRFTASMVESYIDYIVRHDFKAFKQVGFIGTPYYDKDLDK